MNEHQILEEKLRDAVEHSTPDVLDRIKAECAAKVPEERERGAEAAATAARRKRRRNRWIAAAAAVILLFGGAFGGMRIAGSRRVDAVVAMDVNPSIEIEVNKNERVLAVRAVNADAEEILDGMDLLDTDLKVAINALVGSMLKKGYIDERANSVLISVESDDAARSAALRAQISEEITALLGASALEASILSQNVDAEADAALAALADQYGISTGKAKLIQEIIAAHPLLQFENLAGLSINDLKLLAEKNDTVLQDIETTGSASEKAYIGKDAACDIAFAHAGVTADNVRKLETELDLDNGVMVYEVEFVCDGLEYDYEIEAKTGKIVKYSFEGDDDWADPVPGEPSGGYIGAEAAKQAALTHAGVTASEATVTKCELDDDDGRKQYEVEFATSSARYEYEIEAGSGKVLKYEKKLRAPAAESPSGDYIGKDAARDKAFAHYGVDAGAARDVEVEFKFKNGYHTYEVEFKAGGNEYEVLVDAASGAILKADSEKDD